MIRLPWLLFIGYMLLAGSVANAQNKYVSGSVYVKVKDTWQVELAPYDFSWSGLNNAFLKYGVNIAGIKKPFPDTALSKELAKIYRIPFTDTLSADSLVSDLRKIPCIAYAEKEARMELQYTPNDLNANQWYLIKINAKMGWDFGKGSPTIKVAIVDNGVLITHADLAANIWTNPGEIPNNLLDDDLNGFVDDVHGYDVADKDNDPNPPSGLADTSGFNHGTHCAGLCAAVTDNGKGIASIGFKTNLIPVKCASDNTSGSSLSHAYDGVYYAIKAKADIISMSFGGDAPSETGQVLMNTANSLGITLVAAAGNKGNNTPQYPAAHNHVIAVGATDENDRLATFSNFGSYVDLVAPGVNMFSTFATNANAYRFLNGTSMSTPLVAGLIALVKSQHLNFSPEQLELALKNGCDNINNVNPDRIGMMGAGRINAFKAVNPSAGVAAMAAESGLVLYPNPASDFVTIKKGSNTSPRTTVVLTSISGKEILRKNWIPDGMSSDSILDVSDLLPGMYLIHVDDGMAVYSVPLLIQK